VRVSVHPPNEENHRKREGGREGGTDIHTHTLQEGKEGGREDLQKTALIPHSC